MAVAANTLGLLFRIGVDAGSTQAQLKAVTDQLKTGVDGMKGSVSDLTSQFKIFGSFLEGLVAGGISGFIEGVIKSATATADWVNELDRASQATSIEIRTLAQLEGAFKEAGGSINSMIGTFDIFAGNLEKAREGNNKLIDILEKYGIVSRDVTEATDQAFRALGSMTDQTEKARLAQELFGKGGARQILQFKDLKDGIAGVTAEYKGLGDAIDPKLIEAAQAYEKESKKLDATLIANRSIIAGLVLPAWVDFNISIRKAMESLTNFKSLAEHANEALNKFKIGPGLPAPEERGLGGEVVTEAEARASTEAGIAARSLEAARKVKDEKIKIAKQTSAAISDADRDLAAAQKELADQQKQTGDIIIQNMEALSKGLNEAILAASDPKALIAWKLQMLDFGDFLVKEAGKIVKDIAQQGQDIPGGFMHVLGLDDPDVIQGQLDAIHNITKKTFSDDLLKNLEDSGVAFKSWSEFASQAITGVAHATEDLLTTFILTGHGGAQAFKALAAGIISSLAVEAGVRAIMELAYGLKDTALAAAAATNPFTAWQVPFFTAAAAAHYASAATFGIIAGGAAAVGIGIGAAGGLGGGGTSGAAAGGGFGGETKPGEVTINERGAGGHLGILLSIDNHLSNITTAPPGHVLQRGAEENPMVIGQANNEASRRDGSISREFLQISGLRTA
jgi:hypothetical protein